MRSSQRSGAPWTPARATFGVVAGLAAAVSLALAAPRPVPVDPPDLLTPPPNGPRRADPGVHALVGGSVHVVPGRVIERATIVIRNGRIESVAGAPASGAPGEPPAAPADAQVWDCAGLHIYAGFIEPMVEVDAPMPDRSKPGVHWNIKVTPQRRALDGPGIDAATAKSLRGLGFTSAAIAPRGGIFRGQAGVVSLAEPEPDASASRPQIYAESVYHSVAFETGGFGRGSEGADNTRWDGYPNSEMGAIALVRQTLIDAAHHAAHSASAAAPATALDALAAGAGKRALPLLMNADDELEALRAAKFGAEFGREVILLGSGFEFRRLGALADAGRPILIPLNFPRRPSVAGIGESESVSLRDLMTWEQAPTNPRRVAETGITFALTTAKLRDRGQFREHLRSAIRHGLDENVALAALTTTPAKLLGVESQLGTIETGKRASLIVADGPIFAKKTRLRDVWVDGKRHEINPAPTGLEGTYEVTLDPPPKTPGTIRMIIDKDNGVTLKKSPAPDAGQGEAQAPPAEAAPPAADGKPQDAAGPDDAADADDPARAERAPRRPRAPREQSSKAANVSASSSRLSFTFDHEPFGSPGIFTVSGVVEPRATPRQLRGDGRRADGEPFRWSAIRTGDAPDPRAAARNAPDRIRGVWRFESLVSAVPRTPEGFGKAALPVRFALDIRSESEATLEFLGRTVRLEDLVVSGSAIKGLARWSPAPQGEPDQAQLRVSIDAELKDGKLVGRIGADPTRLNAFEATREGDPPAADPAADRDDDDEKAPDVPEDLPGYPFGPYALSELPRQRDVVFEHATIWTCAPGSTGPIVDGSIRIRNGKIVWVADHSRPGTYTTDDDTEVIDARGKHIAPGIIDCHSHTGISGGVNESGQAVTAEVRIGDVTNPDAINWYRQLAGGVTAVNNLHGSANPIGGQNQVNKIRWGCAHPDDMHFEGAIPGIKFALGENVKWGNSSSDRGGWRYPQTRMGVETLIRDRFIAAKEYLQQRHGNARAASPSLPPRDLELEALAEILAGERLVHCHSYRQDEILMLGRMAREFGFVIGTYQHILEGYKVAEIVRESGGGSGFSDWWAYKVEVQDAIPQGFPIMHEQGVVVSYNSDSDELARRLNVEAGKAIKYSDGRIAPEEALKFVTLNPARQLRIDDRVGSLEAGKDADLVVWSGSPISSLSRCEATYVDGRCLYSLEQDQAMRERNESERRRLIQKVLSDSKRPARSEGGAGAGDSRSSDSPAGRPGRRRPPQELDATDTDALRSGARGLLSRMLDDAVIARRELYLDMVRRGINPEDVRGGECGCEWFR
ncbi:MAG: amidohydrolase family protein [Phycisphaerales bacterium]